MNRSYSPNHVMNLSLLLSDDRTLFQEIQMSINQTEPDSQEAAPSPWLTLLKGLEQRGTAMELESRSLIRHSSYAELCHDKLWSIANEYLSPYGYIISEWMTPGHPSYLILIPESIATECMKEAQLAGYGEIKLHDDQFSPLSSFPTEILFESDDANCRCIKQTTSYYT
jgi:hypothetical protein